jgi:hypothetical protein
MKEWSCNERSNTKLDISIISRTANKGPLGIYDGKSIPNGGKCIQLNWKNHSAEKFGRRKMVVLKGFNPSRMKDKTQFIWVLATKVSRKP